MKIINTLFLLLFISINSPAAIQCGSFYINPYQARTTVNGDPVEVADRRFTSNYGNYDNAIITLYRGRITDQHYSFILTSRRGKTTLEYVTDETPPRVLNRENCNGDLSGFNW